MKLLDDRRFMVALVVAAAVIVYVNSLWNRFAYDDLWIIFQNSRIHQLTDLRQIWLTPYWPEWGAELGLYRPLSIFLFALQWAVSGGEPWLFHAVNVVLHAAACVLVFCLADKLFTSRVAFGTAMLFAVHPLHTEAVANVVGQSELVAALTVLAACVVYVSRPAGQTISRVRVLAIVSLYAVALLAKEHAVVLPGLLVLLDVTQQRVTVTRAQLRSYGNAIGFMMALLVLVLLAYLTLRLHVLGNLTGTDVAPGLPFLKGPHRILNAFRAWPEFVRLLFFPIDLTISYAPAVVLPVTSVTPMVLLGVLLAGVTAVLMLSTPSRPRIGLAAGWFLVTVSPVSNFIFPIGVLIAERTLYLPSVAVCFLAGYAWEAALAAPERETRRLSIAIAIIVLIGFGARTVVRNPDWRSLVAVWQGLARDHPESYQAQWVYAVTAAAQGRHADADRFFQLADRTWSGDSRFLMEAGAYYLERKNYSKAIDFLERSRTLTPWGPRTHQLLGYAYLNAGRPADALASAKRANTFEGAPKVSLYGIIADAYDQLTRHDEAAGAWRAAAHSPNGGLWLHYARLARSLALSGRHEAALSAADTAHTRAQNHAGTQRVISQLRTAIAGGCYQRSAALASCDVLQNWTFSPGPPAFGGGK